MPSRRSAALLLAAAVTAGTAGAAVAAPAHPSTARHALHAGWVSGPKAILWTRARELADQRAAAQAAPPSSPTQYNNLVYHGGAVMHHPRVYLVFWGTEWKKGFRVNPGPTYTSKTIMNYERQFFANVGGSPWAGVDTQYCDGITAGAISCAGESGAKHVGNFKHELHGVWVDGSAAPAQIDTTGLAENVSHDPIASEALKASAHFQDHNVDSLFMVFTPPGHTATAYGSVYCAYHSEVTPAGGQGHGIRYAFMPYTPEQGSGCGGNSVNKTNDKFGNGYLDSYTLAGGHEWQEAVSDPDAWPFQDGWNDAATSENGDKCAYFDTKNIKLGRHLFAVQPLWSNEGNGGTGGCGFARGTGTESQPFPPVP
jgi:hypothetical protein